MKIPPRPPLAKGGWGDLEWHKLTMKTERPCDPIPLPTSPLKGEEFFFVFPPLQGEGQGGDGIMVIYLDRG